MLDERKTKEEQEIHDERRKLENERIRIAEDYRRYEASSRLQGSYTPIPDDDSAYSSSRDPSRGSVSIYNCVVECSLKPELKICFFNNI